jgi:HAD superfamily hydrolase (TIGR01490 family)
VNAAYFDLDKTVIAKASIAAFGGQFRRGGLINRRTVLRAVAGQLVYSQLGAGEHRMAKVRETMLALTRGWEAERVRTIVRDTLLQTMEPLIYAEALELMEAHRANGDRVYLVSAAPEEIVEPMSELLVVDGWICSRAELDAGGCYTGRMGFYADGPRKAEAIVELAARGGIDLENSFAYSDSINDLPMLEVVGHPVAVNADRALGRLARARGWETRQFQRPVRVRDRVPNTPAVTTSLALAGAVVLIGWYGKRARHAALRDGAPVAA